MHLLGLVVIAAAVLVVDMRLFGVGLRDHPVAQLARDAQADGLRRGEVRAWS